MANQMMKIGEIWACIAGDERYTTQLSVYTDGKQVEFVKADRGAVGGMDGDGRTTSPDVKTVARCKFDAATIASTAKKLCKEDDTIRHYGKPTKEFCWGFMYPRMRPFARGLSKAAVQKALDALVDP